MVIFLKLMMAYFQSEDGVHALDAQLVDQLPVQFVLEEGQSVRHFFGLLVAP